MTPSFRLPLTNGWSLTLGHIGRTDDIGSGMRQEMGFWSAVGKAVGLSDERVVQDFEQSVAEEANSAFAADPSVDAKYLWMIAKEDNSVWPLILANPNCTAELAAWIRAAEVDPGSDMPGEAASAKDDE